jgi:mono/diheme cytochrome c family protein
MKPSLSRRRILVAATLIAGFTAAWLAPASAAAEGADKPYSVDCGQDPCQTDKATYVGWRTYHAVCHVCHGPDGNGSSFAPNLAERLQQIDRARFEQVVNEGFQGQMGVMPGFGQNPNVRNFVDELYAYLMARSDGVLKPGRPQWSE